MSDQDIRWKQRFSNFQKALSQLEKAVLISKQRALSELEEQGLIQSFEFTHELAWNVMKDYLDYQGISGITGPRDATKEAFQKLLITDGEVWMEMIKSRNKTSHTYNESTAHEISKEIRSNYFELFKKFSQKMSELSKR